MTNIEEKLIKTAHKQFLLENLVRRNINKIEEHILSLSKDCYFSDSWEQSMQIHKDIEKLEQKVSFLASLISKITKKNNLKFNELFQLKKICFHPYW